MRLVAPLLCLLLAPGLAGAQDWDAIGAHVRARRDADALAAPRGASGADAAYLRGRLHERRGRL
ncbi:MAG TPA: hypothetical protein RMG95_08020, partial [Polyangiaceae bacterium LLY-WYZ-15_(1-7)]|nr:hypothetical protein [Polyangiaceae bacterium LLY-WYZ-15_(1-7)]